MLWFLMIPGVYIYTLIEGNDNVSLFIFAFIWIVTGLHFCIGFKLHWNYYNNDKGRNIVFDELSNVAI